MKASQFLAWLSDLRQFSNLEPTDWILGLFRKKDPGMAWDRTLGQLPYTFPKGTSGHSLGWPYTQKRGTHQAFQELLDIEHHLLWSLKPYAVPESSYCPKNKITRIIGSFHAEVSQPALSPVFISSTASDITKQIIILSGFSSCSQYRCLGLPKVTPCHLGWSLIQHIITFWNNVLILLLFFSTDIYVVTVIVQSKSRVMGKG